MVTVEVPAPEAPAAAMIPDAIIDEIRTRADIVRVIGNHVQLRRAGRNWKGLCPFHGEKSPSFNVSPDKGFFYCFGCHKKGDAFTFVMEYEGKSFHEAAEQLAALAGIEIPRVEENPALRAARGERVRMLELNKLATQFFREVLAHPKGGAAGRAYLEQRGVAAAITDRFQLGYAPADWHALADFLKTRKADLEIATKLGLIAPQPRAGGYYDRYRDRLVCPVIVPGGEVAGFSARTVGNELNKDGSAPAKYINSPESSVYKKSKLLFGLAQARESFAQKKRAVLVEGNFDVISMHQAGFTEVVAPLGTALTHEQIELLRRLADKVVLLYDGDRAGYAATLASLKLCAEAEVEVLVARRPGHAKSGGAGPLSDGADPDSTIAHGGTEAMIEIIDRATPGFEYFAYEVWGRARASSDAKARALDDAVQVLVKVANETKRDLILDTLAKAMELDERVVRNALARAQGRDHARPRGDGRPGAPGGPGASFGSRQAPPADRRGPFADRQGPPSDDRRGPVGFERRPDRVGPPDRSAPHDDHVPHAASQAPETRGGADDRDFIPHAAAEPDADRADGGPTDAPDDRGSPPRAAVAPAPIPTGPPPTEELEVLALLSDHPSLFPTAETLGLFSLLTDGRLRDMYSAARAGARIVELAPSCLPPRAAEQVLSAKYAAETEPRRRLEQQVANLRHRTAQVGLAQLKTRMNEAQRAGDRDLVRRLFAEIVTTRKQVD
jgi:DNA primase